MPAGMCSLDGSRASSMDDKTYQPPRVLPFKTTGSYETDREAYLKRRESLYHTNIVTMRKTTGKVLRVLKAGTLSIEDKNENTRVFQEHRNLTALDRFFDIRDEC